MMPIEQDGVVLFGSDLMTYLKTNIFQNKTFAGLFYRPENQEKVILFLQAVFETLREERQFNRAIFRQIAEVYNELAVGYDLDNGIVVDDRLVLSDQASDVLSVRPTQNYSLLAAFRGYLSQLVEYARQLEADGKVVLEEQDWEQFVEAVFQLVLDNMDKTTNVQTLRFYCHILNGALRDSRIAAGQKSVVLRRLLQMARQEEVSRTIGNKFVVLAQLVLSAMGQLLSQRDTSGGERDVLLRLLDGPVYTTVAEASMDYVVLKMHYILAYHRLCKNHPEYELDAKKRLLPLAQQIVYAFTPSDETMDGAKKVYLSTESLEDADHVQEFADELPEQLVVSIAANFKSCGDQCYRKVLEILREMKDDQGIAETIS